MDDSPNYSPPSLCLTLKPFRLKIKEKVEAYLYTAWKDGVLYLDNASLQDIAILLGRHYDYHLSFDDSALARLHFSVDLHLTLKLRDMLDYITKTSEGLKVQVLGREVRIYR